MEGLHALVLILLQAPPAIIRGRFDVDRYHKLYGLPARLVGVLLLQLAVLAIADVVYWEFIRGHWDWPTWYLLLRLGLFFGGIIAAALICIAYSQRRRVS